MCGIIGFQGRFDPSALSRGLAAIAHRGPDDSGQYFDAATSTGLGHVRLSILDLSPLGHQPMVDPSGQVVIVFNGEIYNYRELRRELEADGHAFRGSSDTEVLLHMYLRDGLDMVPRLDGMFAFAILDQRSGDLWLVRDAMGIKPIYISEESDGVVFCSELKGILRTSRRPREIDHLSVARYLTYLYCPGEGTPIRGIQRLAPGTAVHVRAGRIVRRWHWATDSDHGRAGEFTDLSAATESVRCELERSVHAQLVSDVPVGAFLSGGVDSSAIVACARKTRPEIQCFTIDFMGDPESGQQDDLPFARLAARHLGVALHEVPVAPCQFIDALHGMARLFDEPIADPAALNVWFISKAARDRGVKVLLSGAGGDDLFSGYRRHQVLCLEPIRRVLPPSVRRLLVHASRSLPWGGSFSRRTAKYFSSSESSHLGLLAQLMEWSPREDVEPLISGFDVPSLHRLIPAEMLKTLVHARPSDDLRLALAVDRRHFLGDHNLVYTDRLSMAAGLEVRVPFLSDGMVRTASRVPVRWMRRGGEPKWILKHAVRHDLPAFILRRPKAGFGLPLRKWMSGDIRKPIEEVIRSRSFRERGVFRNEAVDGFLERSARSSERSAYLMLSLAVIELWFRRYVDDSDEHIPSVAS
jgi:asparagine synthase (glutamine-hydrolysing)